jgi:formylglycine-generating enzyme required for sulfatase activity
MGEVVAFPTDAATVHRAGMIRLEGAAFRMGSDRHYPEEAPVRTAKVGGFWIDAKPVSNRDFARFVDETGWTTVAELPPDPDMYPGARPETLVPSSLVFTPTAEAVPLSEPLRWWRYTPGADWRHPTGPGSHLRSLMDHPVVHVAWDDARAYADWAGLDLPTEAEWEFAARGGLAEAEYAWGDTFEPGGKAMANTWRGGFPFENLKPSAERRTSKVGAYPPNGYGLYDMIGNVWEWTSDWWSATPGQGAASPCCSAGDPAESQREASIDTRLPGIRIPRKVLKGGSHLCAPSYCRRYRPAARHAQPVDTSTSHVGFRCVRRQH